MLRAGSMGTGEQCSNIVGAEAFSRKESYLPNLTSKVTGTLYVVWQFAYKRFKYHSNDFCHPIVTEPLLDTIGLRGYQFYEFLATHKTLGLCNTLETWSYMYLHPCWLDLTPYILLIIRLIKESLFIRVNNPTLNRNIGKFQLSHLWDRVPFSTPNIKVAIP